MANIYWRITRDTLNTGEYAPDNRKGIEGPYFCNRSLPTPITFRLVSDDWPEDKGAYYGVAANDESVEYALDQFGTPDAGMTAAHLWQDAYKCYLGERCKTPLKGHWEVFIG